MKRKGKEQLNILVPTELSIEIRQHAKEHGESQAKFIRRAIRETMARDIETEAPDIDLEALCLES